MSMCSYMLLYTIASRFFMMIQLCLAMCDSSSSCFLSGFTSGESKLGYSYMHSLVANYIFQSLYGLTLHAEVGCLIFSGFHL